jgi:hypothetical protein
VPLHLIKGHANSSFVIGAVTGSANNSRITGVKGTWYSLSGVK